MKLLGELHQEITKSDWTKYFEVVKEVNVNEFLDKFNSLPDKEKSSFLAFIHGAVNTPEIKKYQILESAFECAKEINRAD
ncbi:hypothetical protein ACOSZF_03120 [Cytobacillus firmus]|uniref:hypothetical protein n=1 Tax=Cytobacillus firmus TaxID=1399 RepID=UPI003B9FF5FD